MPTTVKIRRSGTASATPSALEHGEIAINYADGKVFWKNASNVITSFTFQSYALASHTHAASDITSGTLDIARLPAGLTNRLLVSANSVVVLDDVNDFSAEFTASNRLSDDRTLYLPDASGTIALVGHVHAASDITSGTLAAARLPLATTGAAGAVIVGTGLGVSSGTVQVSYGTSNTSACRGDDARLSDTRTPTDNTVSTAKIQNDAVTYAKIQNVSATDRLLGRSSAGAGDVEEITCTSFGRSLISSADAAAARTTLSVQPTASPAFTGTATVENLTLSGSARRIVADFSNADFASRAMFQSSASNASTVVAGVPSGTGSTCVFRAFGASDVTNANFMTIGVFSGTDASIRAEYRGTASAIPLTFHTGGTTQLTISSTGTATFAGQILADDIDTSNSVAYAFDGDTNTGIGRAGADILTFVTNGAERVRVDASGNVGIGTSPAALSQLHQAGTYPTSSNATQVIRQSGTIPSGTTNEFIGVLSAPATQAASFTLPTLRHFHANPQAFGAGSTVTDQYGFVAESSLTGATNNYGFLSAIASGTNRWNFYASGTAKNYFNGETLIGSTTDNGAYLLQVNSQIYATNATIATSDARFKTNVESLTDATNVIESLRPVAFDFIPQQDRNFAAERQVGLIAQEAQAALAGTDYADSVVAQCGDHLGLAYEKLIPLLVKALQESNARIAALEERLNHG
jgi:hypothetical protein